MTGTNLYNSVLRSRVSSYTREQVAEILNCSKMNVDHICIHGRTDYTGQRRVYLSKDSRGKISQDNLLQYIQGIHGIAVTA